MNKQKAEANPASKGAVSTLGRGVIQNKKVVGAVVEKQSLPGDRKLNKAIIVVAGRACQAFRLFDLFCQEYGELTLGELSKRLSSRSYWLLWATGKEAEDVYTMGDTK